MTPDPFNGGVLDLLWIRGSEIGNYSVHLGSWGTTSRVPLGSIYYTQQAIDATRALGGIAVINHPENVDPPKSSDWSEEIVPVRDIVVRVRTGRAPGRVTLQPGDMELAWGYTEGVVTVRVPELRLHAMVVID